MKENFLPILLGFEACREILKKLGVFVFGRLYVKLLNRCNRNYYESMIFFLDDHWFVVTGFEDSNALRDQDTR